MVLEQVPVLNELVFSQATTQNLLNFLVSCNDLCQLHRQVIFVLNCSGHCDRRSDANRRRSNAGEEQVLRSAKLSAHLEKWNILVQNIFKETLHLQRVQVLHKVLQMLFEVLGLGGGVLELAQDLLKFMLFCRVEASMSDL